MISQAIWITEQTRNLVFRTVALIGAAGTMYFSYDKFKRQQKKRKLENPKMYGDYVYEIGRKKKFKQ